MLGLTPPPQAAPAPLTTATICLIACLTIAASSAEAVGQGQRASDTDGREQFMRRAERSTSLACSRLDRIALAAGAERAGGQLVLVTAGRVRAGMCCFPAFTSGPH